MFERMKSRNTKLEAQNQKHKIRSTKLEVQNQKHKIRSTKLKAQHQKHKVRSTKIEAQNQKPKIRSTKIEAQDQKHKYRSEIRSNFKKLKIVSYADTSFPDNYGKQVTTSRFSSILILNFRIKMVVLLFIKFE